MNHQNYQQNHQTNMNPNTINCDDNVIGAAASCGLLGLLTCGVTGGAMGTFLGYICAKDNTGPVGEVFREIGDVTCTVRDKVKKSNLAEKSVNAAKSIMENRDDSIRNLHNSNGEYIRNFANIC